MSTAARIDELRKKFEENPRRYFAPLANELRKAGDLTQAIALCREHLPKQPGHMSGYIVFGQALYESGGLDEARTVFEQALALDPENLIALHHLGHIAKQQGDTANARRWYERALETDPRNDDIAHQLSTLATPIRPVARVTPPVGVDALAEGGAGLATPALPHPAIGLEAMPTPDASLRAVDFDVVNAALTPPTVAPNEPAPALETTPLLDLDTTDASEPASAVVSEADDPFMFDEPNPAPVAETAPLVDLDVNFEEGLVAPEWPDTSELVARVATPRIVTPPSVEVTLDAMEAFGRESQDPLAVSLSLPEPELSGIEADLPIEESPQGVMDAAPADVDLVPMDALSAEVVQVEEFGADEFLAFESQAPEAREDDLVAAVETETPALDAGEELGQMLAAPEPESDDDLPWLAPSALAPHVAEEVTDLVEAMEDDERALGESDTVSVTAWTEQETVPVEASFADVLPIEDTASMAEYAASYPDAEAPSLDAEPVEAAVEEPAAEEASPAFVTETMAELLVAQGFIGRAVTVYEELVRRRPYDPVLSARLDELRVQLPAELPAPTPADTPAYTARARFAALAARRVARRTPAVAMPAVGQAAVAMPTPAQAVTRVPTPMAATPVVAAADESLDALFGHHASTSDAHAAESLAQAFAPIDANTPLSNGLFDAPAGRTPTPAFGATRQPTPMRAPTPVIPMSSVPPAPASAPTPAAGEFSFDRFFPDPATEAGNQAPSAPAADAPSPAPKAGDDLAQFSAWLKGLGNP